MKNRALKKLGLLGLAVLFGVAGLLPFAYAQPGEFVKGVLQPLADGFPNRPITLIAVDDPGSPDSIYGHTLATGLKGVSPVPVLSVDEAVATGGVYYKLKDVMERDGGIDGYFPIILTLFGSPTDVLVEPITEETGLDLSDINMVIVTETVPYVLYKRKNAPWGKTWADLVKYARANPGKIDYISNGVGSGNDLPVEDILRQLKLKVNKIPQPDNKTCLAVVGAGQGDFGSSSIAKFQPHWEAGKLDVMLVFGATVPPPWDKDPNVVSSKQAGLSPLPVGMIMGLCVPKATPKSHVDWLFKLFKAGASTDLYKQREKQFLGLKIGILTPAEANALKVKFNETAEPVIRALGLHVDQQKKKK